MSKWRVFPDDPIAEAERLGINEVRKRCGWTKAKLARELKRATTEEAFIKRIQRAINELDPPRLLHRDSSQGYTHTPYMALPDEAEAVGEETLREFAKVGRERFELERGGEVVKREIRGLTIQLRQIAIECQRKGIDPTPMMREAMEQLRKAA